MSHSMIRNLAASGSSSVDEGAGGAHGSTAHHGVLFIIVALVLGCLARHALRTTRAQVPYTVVVLLLGAAAGALNTFAFPDGGLDADWLPLSSAFTSASHMDPHLILHIFLPMLVFESSMSVRWTVFKTVVPQAALLATVGLVICSVLTALVAMYIFPYGWGWAAGLTLGAILSATDPVAVVALLKDLGASPRLATLIEGESLLNDGTAIVLFGVVLEALKGAPVEGSQVVVEFLRLAGGGALLGWVVSYCACWWLGKVFNDPLVEISITLLTAYTCFFVAESAHLSGVLAVSMGGFWFAYTGFTRVSADVEHRLHHFWASLTFAGNTLVFFLTGIITVERIQWELLSPEDLGQLLLLYALLHVVRGTAVFFLMPILERVGHGLTVPDAAMLVYGGLRGAVSLVLALFVFQDPLVDAEVSTRILFFSAGIACLTLLVNATTARFVLQGLGLTQQPVVAYALFKESVEKLDRHTTHKLHSLGHQKMYASANASAVERFIFNPSYQSMKSALAKRVEAAANRMKRKKTWKATFTEEGEDEPYFYGDVEGVTPVVVEEDIGSADGVEADTETPGTLTRDRTDTDLDAVLSPLQGVRAKFLTCLRSMYFEAFEDGTVSRINVPLLMHSADSARDRVTKDAKTTLMDCADDFGFTEHKHGWYDQLLFKVSRWKAPGLSAYANSVFLTRLRHRVDLANAFWMAHRKVADSWDDQLGGVDTEADPTGVAHAIAKVIDEAWNNIEAARDFIRRVDQYRPKIRTALLTRQMAFQVLHSRQKRIEQWHHRGELQDSEAAKLIAYVDRGMKRLTAPSLHKCDSCKSGDMNPSAHLPPAISLPDFEEVISRSSIFKGIAHDVVQQCLEGVKYVEYDHGDWVLAKGKPCPFIGIIVRGWASVSVHGRLNNWDSGIVFGVVEALSGAGALVEPRAISGKHRRVVHLRRLETGEVLRQRRASSRAAQTCKGERAQGHAPSGAENNLVIAHLDPSVVLATAKCSGRDHARLWANLTSSAVFHLQFTQRKKFRFAVCNRFVHQADNYRFITKEIERLLQPAKVGELASGTHFMVGNFALIIRGKIKGISAADASTLLSTGSMHEMRAHQPHASAHSDGAAVGGMESKDGVSADEEHVLGPLEAPIPGRPYLVLENTLFVDFPDPDAVETTESRIVERVAGDLDGSLTQGSHVTSSGVPVLSRAPTFLTHQGGANPRRISVVRRETSAADRLRHVGMSLSMITAEDAFNEMLPNVQRHRSGSRLRSLPEIHPAMGHSISQPQATEHAAHDPDARIRERVRFAAALRGSDADLEAPAGDGGTHVAATGGDGAAADGAVASSDVHVGVADLAATAASHLVDEDGGAAADGAASSGDGADDAAAAAAAEP